MGDLWFEAKKCTEDFAIAVRDSDTLFQIFRICRSPKGDVYWNLLAQPDFKAHYSYHASGHSFLKTLGRRMFPTKERQPPTAKFKGTEMLLTSAIRAGDGRAINRPCEISQFTDIMEIPEYVLAAEPFGYQFSVELAEPGADSFYSTWPHAEIIQERRFEGQVPHIVCTLYKAHPEPVNK
ncbi:hypothetical protein [Streptomyces sp. 8N706]|uniref:hypothetical protein n=1 Tax=Streptomyces sp. 8N706 TaxID=3457416 RepID=UPI003FCFFC28